MLISQDEQAMTIQFTYCM